MLYNLVAAGIAHGLAERIIGLISMGLTVGTIISIIGGATAGLAGVFSAVKVALAKKGFRRAIQL